MQKTYGQQVNKCLEITPCLAHHFSAPSMPNQSLFNISNLGNLYIWGGIALRQFPAHPRRSNEGMMMVINYKSKAWLNHSLN